VAASRVRAGAIALVVAATIFTLTGCGSHRYVSSGVAQTAAPASVSAEMAYVDTWWKTRNSAGFGDLDGTDCVNFASQALLARGWAMNDEWGHSLVDGQNGYTKAWISSTAMMKYLGAHPELATVVTGDDLSALAIGDIVQFDWDNSGDRDHTAIVSRIDTATDGTVSLFVASHSPTAHYLALDRIIATHPAEAKVYFWHLVS
jgi:Putative amidase domain